MVLVKIRKFFKWLKWSFKTYLEDIRAYYEILRIKPTKKEKWRLNLIYYLSWVSITFNFLSIFKYFTKQSDWIYFWIVGIGAYIISRFLC